jgi:hypothetical protein
MCHIVTRAEVKPLAIKPNRFLTIPSPTGGIKSVERTITGLTFLLFFQSLVLQGVGFLPEPCGLLPKSLDLSPLLLNLSVVEEATSRQQHTAYEET